MLRVALLCLSVLGAGGCSRDGEDRAGAPTPGTAAPLTPPGCPAAGDRPQALRIGSTQYMGTARTQDVAEQLGKGLREGLGLPVSWVIGEDYDAAVDLLERGAVDIASLSPLSYVQARERMPCLRLLAMQVSRGDLHYSSFLLVRKDSGITALAELQGRRVAFVSPSSASGYLYPMAAMAREGLDVARVRKDAVFLGTHPAVIDAVISGAAAAGATFFGAVEAARGQQVDTGVLRVLALTGRIPFDAVVARPGLSEDLAGQVRDALLALNGTTDRGRAFLGNGVEINGWVVPSEATYDGVRETLAQVEDALRGGPP